MAQVEQIPLLDRAYSWCTDRAKNRAYPWILCALLVLLSWFLAPLCFECFGADSEPWEVVHRKVADPMDTLADIPPDSWLSKKMFRLTVPLIMKVFNLSPQGTIALHFLLGYLTLVLSYLIGLRISKDPPTATLLTAALTFIYFGRAAFFDFWPLWFDGYAYFFLILSIFSAYPFVIFLAATAAAWTDERAFITLGIVFLIHQLSVTKGYRGVELLRPRLKGSAVLLAMGAYLAIRWLLAHQYGLQTSYVGAHIGYLQWTLHYLPIGVWTFLEGMWLIYFAALFMALQSRHYFFMFVLMAIGMMAVIISGCVSDITRSGSYFVPLIFIVLIYLMNALDRAELRRLMLFSTGICLLFPATFVCIDWPIQKWLQAPMFIGWLKSLLEYVIYSM